MSVPTGSGYYQTAPEVSMDWIAKGWDYFKQQAGLWIGVMLLLSVLSIAAWCAMVIPTGMLQMMAEITQAASRPGGHPPSPQTMPTFGFTYYAIAFLVAGVGHIFLGGVYRLALRQIRGEAVSFGDMFQIGDVALSLFVSGLLTTLLTVIGSYACVIPGLIAYALTMFTPLIIVDRKVGPIEAIKQSFEMLKSQVLMATLFYLVAAFVAGLGAFACGVGMLATYPIFFLATAYGYSLFTQTIRTAPQYGAAQPGVWPPPPSITGQPNAWPPQSLPSAPAPPPSARSADWPAQSAPPPFEQTLGLEPGAPPEDRSRP